MVRMVRKELFQAALLMGLFILILGSNISYASNIPVKHDHSSMSPKIIFSNFNESPVYSLTHHVQHLCPVTFQFMDGPFCKMKFNLIDYPFNTSKEKVYYISTKCHENPYGPVSITHKSVYKYTLPIKLLNGEITLIPSFLNTFIPFFISQEFFDKLDKPPQISS